MMKKTHISNLFFSSILVLSLFLTNKFLQFKKPTNPDSYTTLSTPITKIISLGNYRFISSFIWTKTLLDADVEHVKNHEYSWLYYRFKLISDLDPMFYENYLKGGVYLSIIKDDIYGAAYMFDKGLSLFPGDYHLMYHSAFNYHFQIKDFNKSLELYQKIQNDPKSSGFNILPRLISEAKNKINNKNTHLNLLRAQLQATRDPEERRMLELKIEEIKKASDN